MRADVLNLKIYSVRTEMTYAKHILIVHIFSMYDNKSKYFQVTKNLS